MVLFSKSIIYNLIFKQIMSRRLPVYILIDTSGSMKGEPIESVKVGLSDMIASLRLDPYALETACISIITYDKDVKQILPLTELENLQLPEIACPEAGPTHMGAALELLCQRYDAEVNMGSKEQKGDWMPLLFILTDGKPSDLLAYDNVIPKVKAHQFTNIVACAAGPKAKTEPLKKLTNNVFTLDTMDSNTFKKFFQWVSINIIGGGKTMGVTDQVELPAPPTGESFYAERGSIVYVDEALQRDVEFNGSGSSNGGLGSLLGGVLKSALSGESILIIRFYNHTNTERKMVLSGSCCALVPIRLQGENLICRRGHYVASTNKINLNLNISLQGLVGGVGLFQKIDGNATVFLDSLGSPIEKILGNGETIEIDENHIVAFKGFSPSQIQAGWSVGNVLRGEGVSLMKVTGPGKVYLSPLPMIVYKNN